jgi:hypothetical protein
MKKPTEAKRLSQPQRRFLENRIIEIVNEKKHAVYNYEVKDPPNIKAARRLIEQHDKSFDRRRDMRDSINKAASQCRQALLFSTEEDAVRLIDLFEGKKF